LRNILSAALLCAVIPVSANAVQVAYGMGEADFKDQRGMLQACTIAENNALKFALEKFADRQYTMSQESKCVDSKEHSYCSYIKEIDATTSGSIKSIVDRIQHVKDNTCYVELKAEIHPLNFITAEVESGRIYNTGDSIDITVRVGQPVYLHIFNMHKLGVDILFPNVYNKESLIDDRFYYPHEGDTVEASLPKGENVSNETLLYVFTKRRQDFNPEFVNKESLEELLRSLPVSEKKLIQQHIIINRSKK
jgi:hypothetical protein